MLEKKYYEIVANSFSAFSAHPSKDQINVMCSYFFINGIVDPVCSSFFNRITCLDPGVQATLDRHHLSKALGKKQLRYTSARFL